MACVGESMIQIKYYGGGWDEYRIRGSLCRWTIHGRWIGVPIEDPIGAGDLAFRRSEYTRRCVEDYEEEGWFTVEIDLHCREPNDDPDRI